jgi:hypothetical protein
MIWNYLNKAFNTLNMNNIQNLDLFPTFLHTPIKPSILTTVSDIKQRS